MPNIIIKNYEHMNRTMGCYVSSRADYEKKMQQRGFVDWETGERLAEEARKRNHKDYNGLTKEAMEVCMAAKNMADKKGNIKAGSRLIDGMKKTGVSFDHVMPAHYQEGGFEK